MEASVQVVLEAQAVQAVLVLEAQVQVVLVLEASVQVVLAVQEALAVWEVWAVLAPPDRS